MQQPGSLIYACANKFLAADLICSLLKNAEVNDELNVLAWIPLFFIAKRGEKAPHILFQKLENVNKQTLCPL